MKGFLLISNKKLMRQLFTAIIVSKVITAVIADANVIFIKVINSCLSLIESSKNYFNIQV